MLILSIVLIAVATIFSTILTPYICGMIFGYLLAPLVNRLENFGLPRVLSSIFILIFGFSLFLGSIFLFVPAFVEQVEGLILSLPEIYNWCLIAFDSLLPDFIVKNLSIKSDILGISELLKSQTPQIASEFALYAFAVLDFILLLLIVPVITFYLLIDWNKIMLKVSAFIPEQSVTEISRIIIKIDSMLSGFVRGQLIICVTLGVFYSVGLSFLGLSYGLVIGLFSGFISFIPFVGAIFGSLLALSVAFFQFWGSPFSICLVFLIFCVGQLLESNFLTPKLIGGAVKLHPVLIMLSISIGGAIAGLSGVLLAVPVAGIIGILVRQLIKQHLTGSNFRESV